MTYYTWLVKTKYQYLFQPTIKPLNINKYYFRVTKGKPTPLISWSYKPVDGYDFGDVRKTVAVNGETITINDVKSDHKGIYRCEAVNYQGEDSREVILKVHCKSFVTTYTFGAY